MKKRWKNIIQNTFILSLVIGVVCLPSSGYADCNGEVPSCAAANACIKKTISGKSGTHFDGISGPAINSSCLKKATENGCFMSVPTTFAGSYNTIGYRPNGAGGNPTPRNHYGSDIGTGGATGVKVLAPDDGVIKMYKEKSNGGGRTLVIEHTKKCQPSGNEKSSYHTILRHLFIVNKKSGSVTKGEELGIVGGSNYLSQLCDNPTQRRNCGKFYAIHLHFEVLDGPGSSSSTSAAGNLVGGTYEPYCGGLQTLCGGCSVAEEADKCNSCKTGAKKCGGNIGAAGSANNLSGSEYADDDPENYEASCDLGSYLDSQTCVFCGLFKTIFNAASIMAKTANDNLAEPSKALVGIGFGIWIAVYLLKKLASFQAISPGDTIKGILFQGFRVAVIITILGGALFEVMDLTLNPVMQTGLSFANSLNTNSTCKNDADYMKNIMGYESSQGYKASSTGGLAIDLGKSIICSIKNLEDGVGTLMGLGSYSMCIGWNIKHIFWILPHFGYLLSGAFLWLVGVVLLFSFPWCLIDCILQLCVAAALIPCSVAAFAFKITSKYIKIVWQFFMNAMFNIVFFALIVFIINEMLKSQIGDFSSGSIDDNIFIRATGDGLAWWGVGALKIFMVCFFMWCFFDEAKDMANKFAQGGSLGGSKGIGRMIGGTVARAGKAAGGVALTAGGTVASAVGESANSLVGNWARSKTNQMKGQALKMLGGKKITDANGNTVGYRATFNFLGFKQTREVTKDANGLWTQTKETHQRSKAEKAFVPMRGANGEMTYGYVTRNAFGKVTGIEAMNRRVDAATGNIIYETADGKGQLVTDNNGKMLNYKRRNDSKSHQAVMHGGVTKVNDSFMRSKVLKDGNGKVIGVDTEFSNTSAKYLLNKDGTTNMHAYREMMAGAQNKEMAAAAIVGRHMEARGQQLPNRFQSRDVQIGKDGTVNITQVNRDGSVQKITAKMEGNQMIIQSQTTTANGDIIKQTSNGIQSKTVSYIKQPDGTFTETTKYEFSDHAHRQGSITKPLDANGRFGYGVDSTAAMRGFTDADLKAHAEQIAQQEYPKRTLRSGAVNDIINGRKSNGPLE